MKRWIAELFCWDGALPLVAAAGPLLVKTNFLKGHIAEVVVALFVPVALALLRSSFALRTVASHFVAPFFLFRQLCLALAIVSLLVLEIAVALEVFAPNADISLWIAINWLVYIGLMAAATFPPRR